MRLLEADTKERLRKVRALYEEAFPRSEKKPFGMILRGRKRGNYEVLALEEDSGVFLGLAIIMRYGEMVLLDYFAIAPYARCAGMGSRALDELLKRYQGKKFVLEIESAVGITDAGDQRLRRRNFYLRNGLETADFLVNLFGVEMEIMTYRCSVTFQEYHEIFRHVLPFGMARRVKQLRERKK